MNIFNLDENVQTTVVLTDTDTVKELEKNSEVKNTVTKFQKLRIKG